MVKTKVDNRNINFINEYYSCSDFNLCTDSEIENSKDIWKYKDCNDNDVFNKFTWQLLEGIIDITKNINTRKIGLVAVPTSKVNKESPIRKSIEAIAKIDPQIIKDKYGFDKEIIDFSGLLYRNEDVPSSHKSQKRVTYNRHKETISCTENGLSKKWTTFILLDDVTTCGTIMNVCRNILIEHGAKPRYTKCLALAKTVHKPQNNITNIFERMYEKSKKQKIS